MYAPFLRAISAATTLAGAALAVSPPVAFCQEATAEAEAKYVAKLKEASLAHHKVVDEADARLKAAYLNAVGEYVLELELAAAAAADAGKTADAERIKDLVEKVKTEEPPVHETFRTLRALERNLEARVVGLEALIPVAVFCYGNAADVGIALLGGRILREGAGNSSTWTCNGQRLVLRYPNLKAPGSAWIETLDLSPDGKVFTGKNQIGEKIEGRVMYGSFTRLPTAHTTLLRARREAVRP